MPRAAVRTRRKRQANQIQGPGEPQNGFTVKKDTFRRLAADENNLPRKDQGRHSIPNMSFEESGPGRKPPRSRPRVKSRPPEAQA